MTTRHSFAIRHSWFSFTVDHRVPLVIALVLTATLAAMIINMGVGEYPIAPLDVIKTVLHLPTGQEDYNFIINTLRLPRMLVAALVGVALAIAGTILQALTRNPLAEPSIIGISSGASLVAVGLIVLVPQVASGIIPVAAFAGAVAVALLIYVLAWRGGDSPLRLILVGIGLAAITQAGTTLMITFGRIDNVQRALVWLTGSVYGRSWEQFWPLFMWVAVFAPLAFVFSRNLNAFNLGEEIARGLGSRITLERGILLLTAVALAGSTVAAAGTIGFVGLMAPHLARRLVGANHQGLLPVAAMLGGMIVVVSDLIGRTIIAPIEIPCGLVTAAIGAPFFIFLLWRQRAKEV